MSDDSENPVWQYITRRPYVDFSTRTVQKLFEIDVDVFFPQLTVFGFLMAKFGALVLSMRFLIGVVGGTLRSHIDWNLFKTSPAEFFVEGIDWLVFLTSPTFLAIVAIGLYVMVGQIVEDIHLLKEYENSDSNISMDRPLVVFLSGITVLLVTIVYKAFSVVIIDLRAVFNLQFGEFTTAVAMDIFYLGLVFFSLGIIAQSLIIAIRESEIIVD